MTELSLSETAASTNNWMATGGRASNRTAHAALSALEERRLFRLLWSRPRDSRAAQGARTRLIVANLSLVVPIAESLVSRRGSLPDLVQEGNMALVKAVDRYHPAAGNRFATFARLRIRRVIGRAALGTNPAATEPLTIARMSLPDPYQEEELEEHVDELLEALTIDEASVVRYHFGIGMTEHHTLSQVAGLLGWAPQRVMRLNAQAMTKLRNAEEWRMWD